MPIPLPENPSLEQLKKQARDLQRLVQKGDPAALRLIAEHHPRLEPPDGHASFKRADAQLVLARMYGLASWPKLAKHLAIREQFARPDTADLDQTLPADQFAALAAVAYDGSDPAPRIARATDLLDTHPTLATASAAAMAASGHVAALTEHVASNPAAASELTGPNRWPPLLYSAYSRVTTQRAGFSTLDTARLLLDAGADPNAGFLWRGLVPPFTALTGAFGGGERDQPAHPEAFALARLLLERGADPNDGQALYNNGLAGSPRDETGHLELLLEFGLGTDRDGPWYQRLGEQLTPPGELLYDELEVAAHRGLVRRMQFLVGLGLDLERPVGRSNQSPAAIARRRGHGVILEILADAGVDIG